MSGPAGGAGRRPTLLPARSAQVGDGPSDSNDSNKSPDPRQPGGRPKRILIESACSACRRRKSKCDGLRPSCSRCQSLRTECAYEAEEGESRWSALRRRNQILETERAEVRELISYLQSRPEPEAQDIFQRIRNGGYDDVFDLLRQLRAGGLASPDGTFPGQPPTFLHQTSSASSIGLEQRLPPIREMFGVSGPAAPPPMSTPHLPPYHSGQDPPSSRSSPDDDFDNHAP